MPESLPFNFSKVFLSSVACALPPQRVSSEALEARLAPCYEKLHLMPGRLELMTGIRERRFYEVGTRPSDIAAQAAETLFATHPEARKDVQVLIHASVCRDYLEPATAAVVHHKLNLNPHCLLFDLSNACLSAVNALAVGAGLIESGQVRNVLVVSGENSRPVIDNTVRSLNQTGDRAALKANLATLTLGSGGSAFLLSASPDGALAQLKGGAFSSGTEHHTLCQSVEGAQSLTMHTDSEAMLHAGVALAAGTWSAARTALEWPPGSLSAFVPHQVGKAHAALMRQALELGDATEFSTFEELGNIGAASVGITLALAPKTDLRSGSKVMVMGIGSGLVCGMLGLEWRQA